MSQALSDTVIPSFVRPRMIAEQLNISIQVVYDAISAGDLPATRFNGKTLLIKPEHARAWIESRSETDGGE